MRDVWGVRERKRDVKGGGGVGKRRSFWGKRPREECGGPCDVGPLPVARPHWRA